MARADYLTLESGDSVGRLSAVSAECRRCLEAGEGVTVLPPLHRPVRQQNVDAFAHCGAAMGDTGYDVAEKLYAMHGMFWMHPEELSIGVNRRAYRPTAIGYMLQPSPALL